jgi:hypothetical protein
MSTANVKTDVIDADAHVVENERVWDYLEAGEEKYRPMLVAEPDNPERQHWVLDGEDLGRQVSLAQREAIGRACQKIRPGSRHSGQSPGA